MHGIRMSGILLLCPLIGCEGAAEEAPDVVWRGTHLEYAPQEHAEPLCAGTLPYMDRYVELAADRMAVELGAPVLYVHGSPHDESMCDHGAVGCTTPGGRVYSRLAPHEHELIHGARSFEGFSYPFFEEGVAELFGDDAHLPGRGAPEGDLLEGIRIADPEDGYWYPRMGHFMAYLYDRHGQEVAAELLREAGWSSSVRAANKVLELVTGMPIEELLADYETESVCDQAHYRYPVFPCDAPEALRLRCNGKDAVRIEESLDCADATTLGPRLGEIWKYVAFEVPSDGDYTFSRAASSIVEGALIQIKECSSRCDSVLIELPITGTYQDPDFDPGPAVFLRRGRYSLRISQAAEAASVAVSVWVTGTDCE